jgi:hypothetical protein
MIQIVPSAIDLRHRLKIISRVRVTRRAGLAGLAGLAVGLSLLLVGPG